MSDEQNGLVVFYVNNPVDITMDNLENSLKMFREMNQLLADTLRKSGFSLLFVPCFKESTRVEKIDLALPFPPCKPGFIDLFGGVQSSTVPSVALRGFITTYINFPDESTLDKRQVITLVTELNHQTIQEMASARFSITIVPAVKEGSRSEKIDMDAPFPRFTPAILSEETCP